MKLEALLLFLWGHIAIVLVILCAAYLARNRYNLGLNKYPGPFLASITDLWRFVDVYKRRPELTHRKLHAQHGDVVRLGPNVLSFADPKALKTIYGLNKGFIKSEFYPVQQAVARGHRLPSLFTTTSEGFHAQLRRSVNSAFAMSTIVQFEPLVDSTTTVFLSQTEKLYAETGLGCDFYKWLQYYAFDVIGEMTYSERHGFVEQNRDIDGIIGILDGLFDYVAPIGQIPIFDKLFRKNPLYLKASQYGLVDVTFPVARFARENVSKRYQVPKDVSFPAKVAPVPKPDLLARFLQAQKDHPEFMTDSIVLTLTVGNTLAGSDTTAISLSAVFYYLLKNPRCLHILRKELDDKAREGFFSNNSTGLVTWAEGQELTYLDACIKEAFRLHPAAGLLLERIVPEEGIEITGRFVPGGTIVGCNAWIIHQRPEIFGQDAAIYRPERWLVDPSKDFETETKRIKEMNGNMFQFGMGARTCIGKNISLLEMYKLVPAMLRRFEIDLQYPAEEWTLHNAWFVKQRNFRTVFRSRELVKPASSE